jgi:hypothetical protein
MFNPDWLLVLKFVAQVGRFYATVCVQATRELPYIKEGPYER